MATNPLFSSFNSAYNNEQLILEDLIVEYVKMMGIDCYYIPRESEISLNNLFGEQPDTALTNAYPIELLLMNFGGYDGQNEVMTKLGLEVHSSTNLVMTRRSWQQYVGIYDRPHEGDLIYVPLLSRLFEIRHADDDKLFHALGRSSRKPYFWELRVEEFKYSQENISTGITEIDAIETLNSYIIALQLLASSGSGNYVIGEDVYQGMNYLVANTTARVADWNPHDKILSVTDIRGTINANVAIVGTQSTMSYTVASFNDRADGAPDDTSDNSELYDDASVILDTSETNPLG